MLNRPAGSKKSAQAFSSHPTVLAFFTISGSKTALRSYAFLPEATEFRHWRSGAVISESPLGEAAVARFGVPYYHMHRGDLLKVLVAAAEAEPAIRLLTGVRVETFQEAVGPGQG